MDAQPSAPRPSRLARLLVLGLLLLSGAALAMQRGVRPRRFTCPPVGCVPGYRVDATFYQEVLEQAGLPVSPVAVQALRHWAGYEQSRACWNPLAVARLLPNWRCDYNSRRVQHYPTRQMGIQATVETLQLPMYEGLRTFLAGRVFPRKALERSLGYWIRGLATGCGGYCPALLQEWAWLWQESPRPAPRCPDGWFRLYVWQLTLPAGPQRRTACVPTIEARMEAETPGAVLLHWRGWRYLGGPQPKLRRLGGEALLLWVDGQRVTEETEPLRPGWHFVEAWALPTSEGGRIAVLFEGMGRPQGPRPQEETCPECAPPCLTGQEVPESFFVQVLRAAGLPTSSTNVRILLTWQAYLNGQACWNPLGLYRAMPGWSQRDATGQVHYRDPAMGVYAAAAGLGLPQAAAIRDLLRGEEVQRQALERALSLWHSGRPNRCGPRCQSLVQRWLALAGNRTDAPSPAQEGGACRPRRCPLGRGVEEAFFLDLLETLDLPATPRRLQMLALWQEAANSPACWNPLGLAWDTGRSLCADASGGWHFTGRTQGVLATALALRQPEFRPLWQALVGHPVPREDLRESLARWFGESPWTCVRCIRLLRLWRAMGVVGE